MPKRKREGKETEGPTKKKRKFELHPLEKEAQKGWKIKPEVTKPNMGYAQTGSKSFNFTFSSHPTNWRLFQVDSKNKHEYCICENCCKDGIFLSMVFDQDNQMLCCAKCGFSTKANILQTFNHSTTKQKSGDDSVSKFLKPYSDQIKTVSKSELCKMKRKFFFTFQTHNTTILNQSKITTIANSCKVTSTNLMRIVLNQPSPIFTPQEFEQCKKLRNLYDQIIESKNTFKFEVKSEEMKIYPHGFKNVLQPQPKMKKVIIKETKPINTPLLTVLLGTITMPQSLLLIIQNVRSIIDYIEQIEDVMNESFTEEMRIRF